MAEILKPANATSKEGIEEKVKKYFNDQIWDSKYKLNLEISEAEPKYSANNMYLKDWIITFKLNPDIENKLHEAFDGIVSGFDFTDDLIYTVIKHEKGHWDTCPKDIAYEKMIYNSIYRELSGKDPNFIPLDETSKKNYTHYVFNIFADMIVNLSNKGDRKFEDGRVFSYYLNFLTNPQLSDLYYVFVNSQVNLLNKPLAHIFSAAANDPKEEIRKRRLEAISKDLLAIFVGQEIAEKAFATAANDDAAAAAAKLKNEGDWKSKLSKFIDVILPLLNNKDILDLNQGLIGANVPNKDKTSFNEFDAIYNNLTDKLILKNFKAKSPAYNLYLRKEFSNNSPNLILSKTLLVKNDLNIPVKKTPYSLEVPLYKDNDILFIADVSGSMKWTGNALDGSLYDMCIRSIYSVFNYMARSRQIQNKSFGLIQFSEKTNWSGWTGHGNLTGLKENIFKQYQNSGTTIDVAKLKEAFNTASKKFMVILISDGWIFNDEEVINALKPKINANEIVFFKINSNDAESAHLPSRFTDMFRALHGNIIEISKPEDLVNRVVLAGLRR
ncbi:MAG: hypothetical protein M1331_03685 [Candidatus Marsarchaeota archaeon]|nr:hypothetical protein [Candidatus Marsarchaeota archaeon]MCL5106469.1 hypothetical protein [Candidatus Marsarchaeota archaeon]